MNWRRVRIRIGSIHKDEILTVQQTRNERSRRTYILPSVMYVRAGGRPRSTFFRPVTFHIASRARAVTSLFIRNRSPSLPPSPASCAKRDYGIPYLCISPFSTAREGAFIYNICDFFTPSPLFAIFTALALFLWTSYMDAPSLSVPHC